MKRPLGLLAMVAAIFAVSALGDLGHVVPTRLAPATAHGSDWSDCVDTYQEDDWQNICAGQNGDPSLGGGVDTGGSSSSDTGGGSSSSDTGGGSSGGGSGGGSGGSARAIETPDGTVYIWDGDQGIYRHVPDSSTAFAMGLTWCGGDWCETVHYNSASDAGNCCGGDWPSSSGGSGSDAGSNSSAYDYSVNSAVPCVSGIMNGDGLYSGSLSLHIPYNWSPQTFWWDVTVKITNANVLGFVGTAQLWFRYPQPPHFDADLTLLPFTSHTITSTIYQGLADNTNLWGSSLSVNFQIWLSAGSDAVALEYQVCLH